jgi:signal transduction histidine kinase
MLLGIRWKSMRLKIIAWTFVPAAIILGAVALVIFVAYQRVTEELVIERDQDLTRLAASQLTSELREYSNVLATLARTADIYRADPLSQQAALKRASNRLVTFDGGVLILNTFGKVVAAEPPRPDALGQDWSDRPYFHQILRSSEPVFSNIVSDGLAGRPVIAIATPILDDQEEFRGTIVGLFRLGEITISPFYGSIIKLRVGESGNSYLVDNQGRLIYHPDTRRIGEDISDQAVVQQVLAGKVGAVRTYDFEGQDIVAGFAPVPGTTWGLITEERWATLLQASQIYQFFLLFLLGLGILVPMLMVMAGVKRLTKPINDLIQAAQAVAAGNFGQTIKVNTGDELEELARQFNLMSAQLKQSYARLEERVAGRTHALKTINAITAVVSRSLDLEEILQDALNKTLEITGMDAGGAYRLIEAELRLSLMAHHGLSPSMVARFGQLPLAISAAAQAVNQGRPVVSQVANYPPSAWRDLLSVEGWRVAVSIPLISRGKPLGTINLLSRTDQTPAAEQLSLLAAIGQQIGVAMENARLYEQAQQLAAAEERQRLARDLHDSVTQALYGVTLYAEAANRLLRAGEIEQATHYLSDLRVTAQEALGEIRLLIFELRPPILEKEGLAAALRARLESVEGRSGLKTIFQTKGNEQMRLPLELETGLYRIAQEALNNVLKHAQAQQVRVCLQAQVPEGRVILEVNDDGQGFEVANGTGQGKLGLHTMRERAALLGGELVIKSKPGLGTQVRVEVKW